MILTEDEIDEVLLLMNTKCMFKPPRPFNFRPQSWKKWKRKFRQYLASLEESMKNENCRVLNEYEKINLLIFLLGEHAEETFMVLNRLGWDYTSLQDTIDLLNRHFRQLLRCHIYGRLNFHRRMQMNGESIVEFIKAIKFLADQCNFREDYETMMRDKMVIGIISDAAREKMFVYDDMLTFEKACRIAYNEELRQVRRPG